jgi:carbamoyl-phosphate synthase large subunit
MKSVGEAMSIGKTFKQSLQKAMRSLEIGRSGFGSDGKGAKQKALSDEELQAELHRPNAFRLFCVHEAFRRGWSVEQLHELTGGIDVWFLRHMHELAAYEDEIRSRTKKRPRSVSAS